MSRGLYRYDSTAIPPHSLVSRSLFCSDYGDNVLTYAGLFDLLLCGSLSQLGRAKMRISLSPRLWTATVRKGRSSLSFSRFVILLFAVWILSRLSKYYSSLAGVSRDAHNISALESNKQFARNKAHNFSSSRAPNTGRMSEVGTRRFNAEERKLSRLGFRIEQSEGHFIRFSKNVTRNILGNVLDHLSLRKGVEIGVQRARFAVKILKSWRSCEKYILVDLWAHQENYADDSNVDQALQNEAKQAALSNVEPWKDKIEVCHNYSETCAARYRDSSLDYAYIDARHDFNGVLADLNAWYPKVRFGGILAGHDYSDSLDVLLYSGQDWNIQGDGSLEYGRQAVKGAVNLFFAQKGHYITWPDWYLTTYRTWVVMKSDDKKTNNILHFIDLSCLQNVDCKLLSVESARTITEWEQKNVGFISLVWTADLLTKYFPDLLAHHERYRDGPLLFEDFVKFHILYKFGGLFIDFHLHPVGGLATVVNTGTRSGLPFALCGEAKDVGNDSPRSVRCERLSTLLIGSSKGNTELLNMAGRHRSLLSSKPHKEETHAAAFLSLVLQSSNINVISLKFPFPCHPCDTVPFSKDCLAHELKLIQFQE